MSKVNVFETVADDVVERVVSLVKRRGEFVGTMTDLDVMLTDGLRRVRPEVWPASPSALRMAVDMVLPRLRKAGVSVRFERATDRIRTRLVTLTTK